ncbi:MAG: aldose 1-epimerase family protein [Runella sp.]
MTPQWHHKIGNHTQIGGIETSVLDNGTARGTRIAWVNTGTGLRYKVVLDRGMDIMEAFFNQHSLAWLSHVGTVAPQPMSDTGIDWLRTFGGGLLTTCGLSNVGVPNGAHGLHGKISNTPAEIEAIVQPDVQRGSMDFSIVGTMKETTVFGPCLELRRTISGFLGQATIHIKDEVTNRGNQPMPLMLLYHINFGWPLVDEGADILWEGDWQPRSPETTKIFKNDNNFKKCPPPLDDHLGTGEEVAFINPTADESGECMCGIQNDALGLTVKVFFKKEQLPHLTNWQHWGKYEYVTGLEPGTNPPIGQEAARQVNQLLMLNPLETKLFELTITIN